jgi:excisionase family DNA binding protein
MPKKVDLLTKQIAAERLGLSVRRVMELSNDGTFTRHRAFDPDTKREAVMFDADEVEKFKASASATPAPYDPSRGLAVRPRLPLDEYDIDDGDELHDLRGAGRLWLTLAEAAEYSGLPASILQAMVEVGELAALDVGVRPGGHWRVRRLDLDAIEGKRKGAKRLMI